MPRRLASRLLWHLLCYSAPFFLCSTTHAADYLDDRGATIQLTGTVQRIISLAPNVTELIYAAGAGDRLAAVVDYSDFPPQARKVTHIGNASRLDIEGIVTRRPDLVIGWLSGNRAAEIDVLQHAGIHVFMTEPRRLQDIPRYLRLIGKMAGTSAVAERVAQTFEHSIAVLRQRYQQRDPVKVFIQVSAHPLYTLNGEHIVNRALSLCGGRNIFADQHVLAPSVSVESVVARNPEAIIASIYQGSPAALERWRQWRSVRAVANGNLFTIDADTLMRATPRMLTGITKMCEMLDLARQRRRKKLD